jgi:5'-methylthioadenosine phosphorylase
MIGIIGGSGVEEISELADATETKVVETEYGSVEVSLLSIGDKTVAFIPRHSKGHTCPPHKINFKANIMALKEIGVNQIMATNAVGSLDIDIGPGSIVLPDDFLDFTVNRDRTFYDNEVIHIDMTEPFCNRLRGAILANSDCVNGPVVDGGTIVCTEGPRFETPAEIRMFKMLGGDLVGMTGLPEVTLAREREMCYNSICIVSNYASGISENNLTIDEVFEMVAQKELDLLELIYNFIKNVDDSLDCSCNHALDGAEV